jgi:uncharacterized protein
MKIRLNAVLTSSLLAGLAVPSLLGAEPKPLPSLSDADLQKIQAALPAKTSAKSRVLRRVLVFYRCEGFVHGGGIVAGNKAIELLGHVGGTKDARITNQQGGHKDFSVVSQGGSYQTDFSQDYAIFTPENLAPYDAIVFNNTTQLKITSPEAKAALLDFVRNGKGIVGIHAATDNFYDWPEAAAMLGGLFDGHPWGGDGTWAFRLDEPKHKLNRAFHGQGFKLKDEIYQYKDPYTRADRRVLITLDLTDPTTGGVTRGVKRTDKDFAVAWIKKFGKGRVFFCGLGHDKNVFQEPAILQFYLDGIQYALGDLKAPDKPKK